MQTVRQCSDAYLQPVHGPGDQSFKGGGAGHTAAAEEAEEEEQACPSPCHPTPFQQATPTIPEHDHPASLVAPQETWKTL